MHVKLIPPIRCTKIWPLFKAVFFKISMLPQIPAGRNSLVYIRVTIRDAERPAIAVPRRHWEREANHLFCDDVGRMKRSASGDNAGIGSDAGSASLDPAYEKYVPNSFPAGSRNLKLLLQCWRECAWRRSANRCVTQGHNAGGQFCRCVSVAEGEHRAITVTLNRNIHQQ